MLTSCETHQQFLSKLKRVYTKKANLSFSHSAVSSLMLRDCLSVNLVTVSPEVKASHHSATFRLTSDLTLPIRQLSIKKPKHKGKKIVKTSSVTYGVQWKELKQNASKS